MTENNLTFPQKAPAEKQFSLSRRAFITTSVLAGGAVVLAAIPLVSTVVLPSLKKGVGKWVDFGKADKLTPDDFSMLSYEFLVKDGWIDLPQRGFVWAKTDARNGVKVFSSTCSIWPAMSSGARTPACSSAPATPVASTRTGNL